ncbi:MAG: hypothetical protein N3D11_01275 [Candidatus Sumerlaeia bacterium]|nr:hypothetical protein [Candidatus Sumerlaeia bacterium]
MLKRTSRCLTGLVVLAVFISGCARQKMWVYAPKAAAVAGAPLLNKSVAVPPFTDERPNVNKNYMALYLIPLMPFGWQDLGAPEGVQIHATSGLWMFKPAEDLAKATAAELEKTKIFREVFFTNRPSEGDLVLEGRLLSTHYKGYMITYGLSVYGPLLWFVGAPAARVRNDLQIALVLKDNKTGEVVLESRYEASSVQWSWLYYMSEDFNYDTLFANIAKSMVADVEKILRARVSKR